MERKIIESSVWTADLGNGMYQNPILHADYSDPDVIRVGEDFYMVSSSFNMSPCLPVLHSKDLVNWQIINHIVQELPFSHFDLPRHGEGVWAPSIRYHDGKFWVFFATPDEGIFMSTAKDPASEWTPLHAVKKTKGWIDTCPFWDDDGQAYLVSAFAKSRIGFKSILHISKMKADGTELLDEGVHVFDGNLDHETIEGPKMYKRNGYYYIFAPAGGVATGWQTILRSKNIYGPYEDKIVLQQGNTDINGPHQGGWVEMESGESWFLHFQDKGAYGRIVHMQPMHWENDWPVMGHNQDENGIGEPVSVWKKPDIGASLPIVVPAMSDDFTKRDLGLQWQWRANWKKEWYSLNGDCLRLYSITQAEGVDKIYDTPNVLTQKFPAERFSVTTEVNVHFQSDEDRSGLVVLGLDYAGIAIKKANDSHEIIFVTGTHEEDEREEVIVQINGSRLFLRLEVDVGANCTFSYRVDEGEFHRIGHQFTATVGKWIGAQVGIFCLSKKNNTYSSYADFQYFHIDEAGGE
ncbi:glycoside hydrolase 43 family protein [Bacillus sp. FJAT-50079]|uniref:glycoside hydrolase family 43 protein n=1 Tax=Bacillus sp. FJAT-50079 TaxID=2833577 RepID=UPI001BC91D47|nr:glycoside hydrolase 43 family protein [Bacillus sp. FJAT-50079]MBS4207846.1 glycoside hydrolase 43 family protein [Bacillus sp. FJAT-50079]